MTRKSPVTSLVLALALAALPGLAAELALESAEGLELVNVEAAPDALNGRKGLKLGADPAVLRAVVAKRREMMAAMEARGEQPRGPGAFESLRTDHLAIVEGVEFGNGTIEVEVSGQPAPGTQGGARGFVGIAWRLQEDKKTHDCFYLRPTNGRATIRRDATIRSSTPRIPSGPGTGSATRRPASTRRTLTSFPANGSK